MKEASDAFLDSRGWILPTVAVSSLRISTRPWKRKWSWSPYYVFTAHWLERPLPRLQNVSHGKAASRARKPVANTSTMTASTGFTLQSQGGETALGNSTLFRTSALTVTWSRALFLSFKIYRLPPLVSRYFCMGPVNFFSIIPLNGNVYLLPIIPSISGSDFWFVFDFIGSSWNRSWKFRWNQLLVVWNS